VTEVYAKAYDIYWNLGWPGVLPLPPGEKKSPPTGFTGHDGAYPSYADCHAWAQHQPDNNLCLRLTDDMIGIDVDCWGGKPGGQTIADRENRWGKLPYSPRSTSRQEDGDTVSGIRLYRIPAGTKLVGKLPGVDIIQRHHRVVVCWPSIQPEGRQYKWYGIDGCALTEPPHIDDIPDLPAAWLEPGRFGRRRRSP
jgi:Bifunctional DNA primase/polymerase, N-terminal